MAKNKQQADTIYSLSSKPGNYFPFAKNAYLDTYCAKRHNRSTLKRMVDHLNIVSWMNDEYICKFSHELIITELQRLVKTA